MTQVNTAGQVNISSDAGLASTGTITAIGVPLAGRAITVYSVMLAPISTATGAQCGKLTLRDGNTVIATYYVFFTANAASQASSTTWPVGLVFSPVTSLNLLYTAVTDATTCSAAVVWS